MKRLLLLGIVISLCLPVGAAQGALPLSQDWWSNYFSSPSGNIRCREFVKKDLMACITLNDKFAAIVPLYGDSYKQRNVGSWQFFSVLGLGAMGVDSTLAAGFSVVAFAALSLGAIVGGLVALAASPFSFAELRRGRFAPERPASLVEPEG